MLPLDSEFILLYILYFFTLLYFLVGYLRTKKAIYKVNLIAFVFYLSFMVFIFLDKENFRGGNSLAILFYGFIFLLIHISINGIVSLTKYILNDKKDKLAK